MPKNNNLRSETDDTYYFGELQFWYKSRQKEEIAVIVEAKTDEKLFEKLFVSNVTFFSVDGWKNVKSVTKQANQNSFDGVLGILDADFSRISENLLQEPNLFLTDCHDTQMMAIHSIAFEHVLNFHRDTRKSVQFEKQTKISIKEFLHELCKPIAVLRFLNHQNNLGLVFKISQSNGKYKFLNYEDFIDNQQLSFDEDKFLKTVENKSQKQGFFNSNTSVKTEFKLHLSKQLDLKELCNGHDILNLLSLALEKVIGNYSSSTKIHGEQLEKELIIAYRIDDFKQTDLYKALIAWQLQNSLPNFIKD